MLHGASTDFHEVRAGPDGTGRVLSGRFFYGAEAVLGDGRREVFAPRAFRSRVEAGENVFLLAGHDPERPLASVEAGSLTLRDGDDALHFEARIEPSTSWARDAVAALDAGLTKGLSPGFRVRPGGDTVTRAAEGGLRRTIRAADLFEISVVTAPAYDAAQVALRSWALSADPEAPGDGLRLALSRWRP